ncbi:MAG: Gfo/Idh/MocA family oxidoreductase [Dorea sp.]|jgi:predicted dehydrogenase|nr:Gfo/Idh/MocA family oxidoreductase [Dorea sp.]
MKQIRTGVIGLGFIGRQHIEAVRRIPGAEVAAGADPDPGMEEWCRKNGIARYYKDYKEMLRKEDLDVIHDCTPNHMHYEVNSEILKSGRHIYSEKPLTLESAGSYELCMLAKEKKRRAGVNFNYRNNVMVQEMKGRVLSGRLGEFAHIQLEYLQDWLLYDTDFDWRVRKDTGGASRAVADIGSHCFDTLQYVTGEKVTAVYARFHRQYPFRKCYGKTGTFSENSLIGDYENVPVENEDGAMILFHLEGGMTGSLVVSQVCAGKKNGLKVFLGGTGESMEWNQENPDKLWIGRRDARNEVIFAGQQYVTEYAKPFITLPNGHPAGWTDALTNGMREFYSSIGGSGKEYRYATFEEGYYMNKIVEACIESSRQDCWVEIGGRMT